MTKASTAATTAKPKKVKDCDDLKKQMEARSPDYSQDHDCPDINPATESAEDAAKRKKLENIETINKQPKE